MQTLFDFKLYWPDGSQALDIHLNIADEANPPQLTVETVDPTYDDPLVEVFAELQDAIDHFAMKVGRAVYDTRRGVEAQMAADRFSGG